MSRPGLLGIPPDDIDACKAFHDRYGFVYAWEFQVMLMSQRDPTELGRRAVDERWDIRPDPSA